MPPLLRGHLLITCLGCLVFRNRLCYGCLFSYIYGTAGFLLLLARVTDSPNRIRSIVGDEQRTIAAHGNTDRASPDIAVVGCEAGQEVLIFSCGSSLLERHPDHFIARALVAVPGAMLGSEDVAVIFAGELVALIKKHFQG